MEYRLKYKGKEIDDRLDLAGTAIQEHQDISGLATKEELADALQDSDSSFNKALNNKVDKVSGKGLSTNDYTNEDKEKLASLQSYDDTQVKNLISQNKAQLDTKANKTDVPTKLSDLEIDMEIGSSYDDTEIRDEISLRNVSAVAINEEVEEPEDKYATKGYVDEAIYSAIVVVLNTEV